MQSSEVLAVDIGGTKMAVAQVDRTGAITWRSSAPTSPPVSASAEEVWSVVVGSVALGFGVSFFRATREGLAATARLPYSSNCRISPSPLGPDAPLIGAAAVAWREAP